MPANETIIARILRDAAARIAAADAKVHEANCAFQAGKFEEYMDKEYAKVEKAVQDEYDRVIGNAGQTADGGNIKANG